MTIVQLNLYILSYNNIYKDFSILSIDKDQLIVPNIRLSDISTDIKHELNLLINKYIYTDDQIQFRLLNNIIIDNIYHSIYFCTISQYTELKETGYKLPVNNYGIHSPNIQKIMRILN
jgi:hypothetical protein